MKFIVSIVNKYDYVTFFTEADSGELAIEKVKNSDVGKAAMDERFSHPVGYYAEEITDDIHKIDEVEIQ